MIEVTSKLPEYTTDTTLPSLMISPKGNIILATKQNNEKGFRGILLKSVDGDVPIGYYSDFWGYTFKPLPKGTSITITQE